MRTALVVIDMQNAFAIPTNIMKEPLPNIKKLHAFFDRRGWPVVFTQHGHTDEDLTPPFKNQLVRKLGPDNVLKTGSKDWELIPEIWKITKDAPVVAKNTFNAFQSHELGRILQSNEVDRVVITGVKTINCCLATSISALTQDYDTWLVSDACASDTQGDHGTGIRAAQADLIDTPTTEEAITLLTKELQLDARSSTNVRHSDRWQGRS